VQQTVLDLLADGYRTFVAVDAVGSRHSLDHDTALRRMDSAGATLTTVESALFEWCEDAGTPEFKQISALVREGGPGAG
jgi:nicotinamidase-related amidase